MISLDTINKLQAYDQHLNMILGDVEETVTNTEIDEETFEEIIKVYNYRCIFPIETDTMISFSSCYMHH